MRSRISGISTGESQAGDGSGRVFASLSLNMHFGIVIVWRNDCSSLVMDFEKCISKIGLCIDCDHGPLRAAVENLPLPKQQVLLNHTANTFNPKCDIKSSL